MGTRTSSSHCYHFWISYEHIFFYFFVFFFVSGPKNELQQMPPLYNTYEAKTLHNKFCKDKQNWSSKTNLLKTWLIWNSVFTTIPFNRKLTIKTMCNLVILRSRSSDLLNSVFDWVNLKSHLAIPFNQN